MKNMAILGICLAVLCSCTNNLNPDSQNWEGKYACTLPSSIQNVKASWVPGDVLLVHGEFSADQALVTLTQNDISSDGSTCYVSVDGIEPYIQTGVKSKYYAAYPGDQVSNSSQYKDQNTFKTTNALLMTSFDNGGEFVFEPLVGGVSYTVSGDFDSYELVGNNVETVGYTTLTCRVSSGVKLYANAKGSALSTITGSVVADGKTLNLICFPDQTSLVDGFRIIFYKGSEAVKTFNSENSYDLVRGTFVSIGDITSDLHDYRSPSSDTHRSTIPISGAVELSAAESANCYVVTEPGVYSFKALKGYSTEPLSAIGSVEVLWETWGTVEEVQANSVVAQVDYEKEMVYFRVAEDFHSGNAVIAARDDQGSIMWSWHIWVPETAIGEDLYGLSRKQSMDRNLGALVAASTDGASPKSAGLFYQWGRKDPFPGVGDFASGTPASVSGEAMTLYGGQMSVAKSIKQPTAFANYDGNWNASGTESLWSSSKTMYDPCPPGYRIPYRSESLLFSNYPWDVSGWEYNDAAYYFTVGNPVTTYPLGGYITTDGAYYQYGEGTRVWCSRQATTADEAYNFRIFPNETDGGASYGNGTKPTSNGFAVRCVTYESIPFENEPGTPVKGGYEKFTVNLQELSGLCLHTDGSFLWGVGDQGVLAKIGFKGEVEKVFTQGLDMESVTIDPATGDLYLGCESNWVGVVKAPAYEKAVEIFRVADAENYGNSGVEGISWYKDGMILVGAQTGANLWAYTLDGTVVWKKSLKTVAIGCQEIADICYDPVKDQIWIIDSESQSIYLFNGDATKHLATYKVNYAGNCESVYLDYERSCVWVADDDDVSSLFRVDFTF